jgi:hypothetical protein
LGEEKIEFDRIAWSGVSRRDVVEHRDRKRIVGSVVNEPADCRNMLDAINGDLMAMFGQDRLQKAEVKVDASPCLGEHKWVVGRIPQFIGCRIQDDVGRQVGAEGGLLLGHEGIYPINSLAFAPIISDSDGWSAPSFKLLLDEFFGIEAGVITSTTSSFGDSFQQEHRGIIGDKDVQQPSAVRVRFHTVEELAVTVHDQCIPNTLAIVVDRPTVGEPCLGRLPPFPMRGGSREIFLSRRKTDGPKISEQGGGEHRKVGHGAGI